MKVKNVSYRVNNRLLFENISLDTQESNMTIISGANGSGKSTLLKVVLGILQPSSGVVTSDGCVSYVPDSSERYFIGLSPNLLFEFLQKQFFIETNLFKERLSDLREQFYLNEKLMTQTIQSLSLGEKKKVMLIAAFLLDSDIYVMDEPLSGLDKESVQNLVQLMNQKLQEGKKFIVVSHERQDILPVASQTISL
ncbi:ABC transporter, ATP-binding protein [Streptococcus sp. DD10]|uniref:ABC transporter ATP-binding protein n=1 Tax=Streptococcus sp. DD10 TaxID=1777878 RepID=UPI00079BAFE6|nr:ATP-binding cassette domain-containing protein [Streptococcus sp. DD10]KXT73048.1 ABC transporter, ATP-binding protein [Streptococcus sp. DD10]